MDLDFRADQWFDVRAFGVYTRVILPMVDVAIGTEEEINAATLVDSSKVDVGYSQISAPTIEGDIELAVSEILQRGPKVVVVKRGSKGATLFFKDGKQVDVPGFPVEVYNVLGAGDAFASGFIYGIVHNWDWYKATRMGNACGAIVVTRHGCANFMGYEDEVLEFIESHGGF
jgi:5-dehydro-2-deoxygluconokinase